MWNQSQMKYLDRKSLIDASMQPYPCFLSFKLEEQRAGDNVYYLYWNIEKNAIVYCPYKDSDTRLTRLASHLGVSWSRNSG
jgi:hypothetical protein